MRRPLQGAVQRSILSSLGVDPRPVFSSTWERSRLTDGANTSRKRCAKPSGRKRTRERPTKLGSRRLAPSLEVALPVWRQLRRGGPRVRRPLQGSAKEREGQLQAPVRRQLQRGQPRVRRPLQGAVQRSFGVSRLRVIRGRRAPRPLVSSSALAGVVGGRVLLHPNARANGAVNARPALRRVYAR